MVGAGQPVVVEVGGAGLHFPFKAVPNPHQWETGVVVVVVAELVVEVTVMTVVGGAGLHLPFNAVPKPHQCVTGVVVGAAVVVVAGLHFPFKAVPKPQ